MTQFAASKPPLNPFQPFDGAGFVIQRFLAPEVGHVARRV